MRVSRDFGHTTPEEVRDLGFDYRNDVARGETLVSAEFEIRLISTDPGKTADPEPNARKLDDADIEDAEDGMANIVAVQRVHGMMDGNLYNIVCRATTTNGQVLELNGHLRCQSAP
jgi:hypothetical protein